MQDLIYSPLQRAYSENDQTVKVYIYRMEGAAWTLEVVDMHGNSTVWDEEFETDQAALEEFFRTVAEEGIGVLVGEPSGEIGASSQEFGDSHTEEEWIELDDFLMSEAVSDRAMSLDMLDGYMTAIVVGPTSLSATRWYPGIWGDREEDAPAFESTEEAKRIMGLVIGHYNGIIRSIELDPDTHAPFFDYYQDESGEHVDGELWAYGFMQGLALTRQDWQALFDDPRGLEWLEPIRLLGSDDLSEEEYERMDIPEEREKLTLQIPDSLAAIYRFWLPYREAIRELDLARTYQREHPKIGRNDPCPCGSGKRFKKCCGKASILH